MTLDSSALFHHVVGDTEVLKEFSESPHIAHLTVFQWTMHGDFMNSLLETPVVFTFRITLLGEVISLLNGFEVSRQLQYSHTYFS